MDFTQFENPIPYPSKKDLQSKIKRRVAELDDIPLTKKDYEAEVKVIEDQCNAEFQNQLNLYDSADQKRHKSFWEAMRREHSYGHLSEEQISAIEIKAWDKGHSNGFSEVSHELENIMEFLSSFGI